MDRNISMATSRVVEPQANSKSKVGLTVALMVVGIALIVCAIFSIDDASVGSTHIGSVLTTLGAALFGASLGTAFGDRSHRICARTEVWGYLVAFGAIFWEFYALTWVFSLTATMSDTSITVQMMTLALTLAGVFSGTSVGILLNSLDDIRANWRAHRCCMCCPSNPPIK